MEIQGQISFGSRGADLSNSIDYLSQIFVKYNGKRKGHRKDENAAFFSATTLMNRIESIPLCNFSISRTTDYVVL